MKYEFIKDIHYYMDGDRVIFTEKWHIQRGECCGNGCRHCPFDPKNKKGNNNVNKKFLTKED
jgi:2-iminoacetate synthase ThiH